MAFLDNSGDIILDAVLTDTGRKLLARGDGSFRVTKFALGDDEINYELFNAEHASGSAYYDLNILQSPILEAFTNNTSGMKSKLLTLSNNNLRYLPEIRLNTAGGASSGQVGSGSVGVADSAFYAGTVAAGSTYVALADKSTLALFDSETIQGNVSDSSIGRGILTAYSATDGGNIPKYRTGGNLAFCLDQGIISTAEGTAELPVGNSLYETQYLIEVDNRFFAVLSPDGSQDAPRSFVDDDHIASYFFAIQNTGNDIVPVERGNFPKASTGQYFGEYERDDNGPSNTDVLGRTGSRFAFRIRVTEEIERSSGSDNYLFTTFGTANTGLGTSNNSHIIETNIRVTGMTTGYRVSIPMQIVKKT